MAGAPRLNLDDAVAKLAGVGPRVQERLARLGISTIRDVVFHLPSRYQDRTRITPIAALRPKMEVVIEGNVTSSHLQFGRRRSLLVRLEDATGEVTLRFFYFNREQQLRMTTGCRVRCFGEVRHGPQALEIVHPECRYLDGLSEMPTESALTPVYPTTDGLHQLTLRKLTLQALEILREDADDTQLLDTLIQSAMTLAFRLPALHEALSK